MDFVSIFSVISLLILIKQYSNERMKDKDYTKLILDHSGVIAKYNINCIQSTLISYVVCQLAFLIMLVTTYMYNNQNNDRVHTILIVTYIVFIMPLLIFWSCQYNEERFRNALHPMMSGSNK